MRGRPKGRPLFFCGLVVRIGRYIMLTCCVVRAGYACWLPYALVWAPTAESTSGTGRRGADVALLLHVLGEAVVLHAGELEVDVAGASGWIAVGVGTGERLEAARCMVTVLDIRVRERTDRRHR